MYILAAISTHLSFFFLVYPVAATYGSRLWGRRGARKRTVINSSLRSATERCWVLSEELLTKFDGSYVVAAALAHIKMNVAPLFPGVKEHINGRSKTLLKCSFP